MKDQKQFRGDIQEKYLTALRDLKAMIEAYNGEITLGEWVKSYKLNEAIRTIMTKNKIVTNVSKSNKFPVYEWTTINPNIYMVNKILLELRDNSRKYKTKAKKKEVITGFESNVIEKKGISEIKENRINDNHKKVKIEKCNYRKKKISIFWGLIKIEK